MAIQGIGSTASQLNTIGRKTEQQLDFKNLMAKSTDTPSMSSYKAQASTINHGATRNASLN